MDARVDRLFAGISMLVGGGVIDACWCGLLCWPWSVMVIVVDGLTTKVVSVEPAVRSRTL